jgi:hypothetical protein
MNNMNKLTSLGIMFFVASVCMSTTIGLTYASHTIKSPDVCMIPTPSPTVSPEASPSATPSPIPSQTPPLTNIDTGNPPTFVGSTTNAPASPTCTISFNAPSTPVFTRISPTQVNFAWWPSTDAVNSQDIEYGYSANNMPYGVILDTKTGNKTIADLAPQQIIFARVCAFRLGCSACSATIDP